VREDCVQMAMTRGAVDWKTDMSGRVSLLVYGDLASANVTDKSRQYSKKLKIAEALRRAGGEVLVIDGPGFSDLCSGYPARNRELRAAGADEYLVLPVVGDGVLGGPLRMRAIPHHAPTDLMLDLTALDRGTKSHEETVRALGVALSERGLLAERPGRLAPQFDLGWTRGSELFIAEVKSLSGSAESQQIRLGLGQVLDYAQEVRAIAGDAHVSPVLVLERVPTDVKRWLAIAESAGVHLLCGPAFIGL
jgi:hypothetical protein